MQISTSSRVATRSQRRHNKTFRQQSTTNGLRKLLHYHKHIISGYGACSVSGCNCQSYMGSDQTCQNCGHNYGLHW